jgi:hypothetical protein
MMPSSSNGSVTVLVLALAGAGAASASCGSEFKCVDDPNCDPRSGPDGGGKGGSAGRGGASGSAGDGGSSGVGTGGSGGGGSGGSAGTQGASGTAGDAGPDVEVDAAPDAPTCETEKPNTAIGVFVAPGGSDAAEGGSCGTIGAPCATVKKALSLAVTGRTVYLSAGTYEEDGLALKAGVAIQGGWEWTAPGTWKRLCSADRKIAAVIKAKSADRTLSAVDLGGTARLETLTIASKSSAASDGQSLYGIFATGTSTEIVMIEVAVEVGAAGKGAAAQRAAAGAAPAGSCSPGTGADGANVGTAGTAAPAGTFRMNGYLPSPGTSGGPGGDGSNGTEAPAAPCRTCLNLDFNTTCSTQCASGGSPCARYECAPRVTTTVCGFNGVNGCGGGGGGGGGAGAGGGSAIGVFVWDATLRAETGRISAGRAGNGSAGAAGGGAAQGSEGAVTNFVRQCVYCSLVDNRPGGCSTINSTAQNGDIGGPGGNGKDGGPGGGGSGGHSYAIYKGGTATATVAPDVELTAGAPGAGAGTGAAKGADGIAKPIGP